MAEIRVEPRKRSLAWLWVLLLLAIAAAAAWYFLYGGREQVSGATSLRPLPNATPVALGTTSTAPPRWSLVA
jgi:hypothetical protein